MRRIEELEVGAEDKVFIRVDFNVPIQNGKILDTTRIDKTIPTIKYFMDKNNLIFLSSHLGRPKKRDKEFSLKPVGIYLEQVLNKKVNFIEQYEDYSYNEGDRINLLENLRFYEGEENGDASFVVLLKKFCDVYVNDAFASSHRAHASIYHLPKLIKKEKKGCGFLMIEELDALEKAFKSPKHPLIVIIGGAKVSTKIQLISNLLEVADTIVLLGALAFPFLKALGKKIGKSPCEDEYITICKELMNKAKIKNKKIILPSDFTVASSEASKEIFISTEEIENDNLIGFDIGPYTIKKLRELIFSSKTIIWNGPPGKYEIPQFAKGTLFLGEIIVEATKRGSFSLIGGGDTISAINSLNISGFSYISTAGGALLEYLEGKKLPGITALEE